MREYLDSIFLKFFKIVCLLSLCEEFIFFPTEKKKTKKSGVAFFLVYLLVDLHKVFTNLGFRFCFFK